MNKRNQFFRLSIAAFFFILCLFEGTDCVQHAVACALTRSRVWRRRFRYMALLVSVKYTLVDIYATGVFMIFFLICSPVLVKFYAETFETNLSTKVFFVAVQFGLTKQ